MGYEDFGLALRFLMAKVIRAGFDKLATGIDSSPTTKTSKQHLPTMSTWRAQHSLRITVAYGAAIGCFGLNALPSVPPRPPLPSV